MIETAVILAAGLGTRFGEKTEFMPKGFIKVGEISMIERSIRALIKCGIKKIVIGTGFKREMYDHLAFSFPIIHCVYSEQYASTNSMWTLWNCQEAIGSKDFILLESDLIYEEKAIIELIKCKETDVMLCAEVTKFQDSYFIEFDDNEFLVDCSVDKAKLKVCGELVGIHKMSNIFYNSLCSYYYQIHDQFPKMGYEFALLDMAKNGYPIKVLKLSKLNWYEIDDISDLNYAEDHIIPLINQLV